MERYASKAAALVLIIGFFCQSTLYAQKSKKEIKAEKAAAIEKMVNDKKFVFNVQTVMPTGGRSRQETPGYTLRVSGDTAIADLPYFGRAYSAPINPSEGGIKFNATGNEYSIKVRKRGGWNLSFTPNNVSDVQQVYLTIAVDGGASLQVTSTNRQPISFNGYLSAIP